MRIWLSSLFVLALMWGGVSSDVSAQWRGPTRQQCIQELRRGDPFAGATQSQLTDIAETCKSVSLDPRVGGVRAARARFYAGRAYLMLAGGYGSTYTDEAIRHLEVAVSAGPDFSSTEFGAELRAARLELVRAYRERGRLREARDLLDQRGPYALSADDPAVAYQRATLILAELGADSQGGKEGAFVALRPVFTRSTASLSPPLTTAEQRGGVVSIIRLSDAEIRHGRALLFSLGRELGQNALDLQRDSRDRAQAVIQGARAIEYLSAAAAVVRESNWSIGESETGQAPSLDDMSDVFFRLGDAKLRAAGVAPRRNGPGLECLVRDRTVSSEASNHIREARDAFNAILANQQINGGRRADANWGLGCATLAGLDPNRNFESDLQIAVDYLQRAVGQEGSTPVARTDRPAYLLTLARAQHLQGARESARANYESAFANLTGDQYRTLRSEIKVDIARTYLFATCQYGDLSGGCVSLRDPNPIDLSNASDSTGRARSALNEALAIDSTNSAARLMLAQLHLQGRDWGNARAQLNTLLTGRTRLEDGDPRRALALFLSSRRETLMRQNCLLNGRNGGNCGDGAVAVADATRASVSDQGSGDYRRQACVARILFGRAEGEQYCIADSGRDREQYAQALLFEGMYWLRRAHNAPQGARQDAWGYSLSAFERGLAEPGSNDLPTIYPEGMSRDRQVYLSELLRYGERYVRLCAIGRAGDTETASEDVKEYFRLSGMLPCLVRN